MGAYVPSKVQKEFLEDAFQERKVLFPSQLSLNLEYPERRPRMVRQETVASSEKITYQA